MPSLLLELFSEEIPARMQKAAMQHLHDTLTKEIAAAGLALGKANAYVTPRRVAVSIADIPAIQPDVTVEKKGPKTSAPQPAIDGFLKSSGLTLDKCEKRMVGKDETYFAVIHQKGQPTASLLKGMIEKILAEFPWPKSMRWGSGSISWVRPLHSILCLFDGKMVPVEFAGVTAGSTTYGHRFLAPAAIEIKDPAEYEAKLKAAHVIADRNARMQEIEKQANAVAAQHNLHLKQDQGLLEEVTGLVEWPTVIIASIDAAYMDLPPEVLVSEMRAHQKYFALNTKDGKFSDKFLITSNMITSDGGKAVIAGNERVLRARLADGRFYWDQDRKKALNDWAKGLEGVTFHAKIGTVAQKVERIAKLASELSTHVKGADKKLVERAASLCKADLVSGMVGEFPELQGVMGRYYALQQKEDAAVADAIRDHYLPLGPDSPVPTAPVAVCVALADKLDTLISMFAAGEKPTGSKDPFALRRAALGVIRIILENNLRISLLNIFWVGALNMTDFIQKNITKNFNAHLNQVSDIFPSLSAEAEKLKSINNDISLNKAGTIKAAEERGAEHFIIKPLIAFFSDRLKVMLKDQGIRHDIISAVLANGDDDLVRVVARAKALQEFLGTENGTNLLAGYKRASNIVAAEEKKDKTTFDKVDTSQLGADEATQLAKVLDGLSGKVDAALKGEQYPTAMSTLADLRKPVDAFFDKVMVNADDKNQRLSRLGLLNQIRRVMNQIADFSQIEG